MDGYAIRSADTVLPPARLRVVGTLMAGDEPSTSVSPGEAMRIMTGAQMPPGADAVCKVEDTMTEMGGTVAVIEGPVERGTNVRRAGEDIAAGSEVFASGSLIGPAHVGVLASLGIDTVLVHPLPTVGVLSTGNELAPDGEAPKRGRIRDSNRPSLLARLRSDGFWTFDLGVVPDDEEVLSKLIHDASQECDAIVTSGGVSMGDRDVVKSVVEKLGGGTGRSMQVAVKPGKPLAFGTFGSSRTPVFGLPGNPVSALVSYELFVRPALKKMAGDPAIDRPHMRAVAASEIPRSRDWKLHLLRAVASRADDGSLLVQLSGGQGSHMLRTMAEANSLVVLPDGDGARAGDSVEVILLDPCRIAQRSSGPRR
jgi:molybdenum cofactor synthesis domain-containing protein